LRDAVLLDDELLGKRLSAGISRVDLVPELNLGLAEPPTE
jgi:hypothetical protein